MSIVELLLVGVSLAMDSFAVSICKGLGTSKTKVGNALLIGVIFGLFQGLFPVIGYYFGSIFYNIIDKVDHWIGFVLLVLIGASMIKEAFSKEIVDNDLSIKSLCLMGVATSIDALTVGITFAFLEVNIYLAAFIIFFITFVFSLFGFSLGNKLGNKFSNAARILGGSVLILMGIKILLEHLGLL